MGLKLHVLPGCAFLLLGIGAGSALAQGDLNVLFAPSAADAPTRVFTARKILTMEPANPTATAVAVAGDRILAVNGAPINSAGAAMNIYQQLSASGASSVTVTMERGGQRLNVVYNIK